MPKAKKATVKRKRPPLIIDNSRYPTSEETAKLYKIPAHRVRWLKALAAESIQEARTEKATRSAKKGK